MQLEKNKQGRSILPILRRSIVPLSLLCLVSTICSLALSQESPGLLAEAEIDILALLREAHEKTAESHKQRVLNIPDYTFKLRKTIRRTGKDGKLTTESQVWELYIPRNASRLRDKKAWAEWVLLEKDGKPVPNEKIEKDRLKAGKLLDKAERSAEMSNESPAEYPPLHWGSFKIFRRTPFNTRGVGFETKLLHEKCAFHSPRREIVEGREVISLRFTKCSGAFFNDFTGGTAEFDGKIWIDAADKVFTQLAAWPTSMKFDDYSSERLLKSAPMATAYTKVKEGYWFWRFGRFDCDRLRTICKPIEDKLFIENFDYVRFNVDAEREQIKSPEKGKP